MKDDIFVLDFSEITMRDLAKVGGKNASLGELIKNMSPLGINVPGGFATTAAAYRQFLKEDDLEERLKTILTGFDTENTAELQLRGGRAREAVLNTPLPKILKNLYIKAYRRLVGATGSEYPLAVRSSATAEDLPEASFAGAAESFLNVKGEAELLTAIHKCYASLFTDRAISYRRQLGFDDMKVALSVGVQIMVRSDLSCSGVMFTLDTESGFRDVVQVSGAYGFGEFIVKGTVTPDEWLVFKPTLSTGTKPIISRSLGSKKQKLVCAAGTQQTVSETVPDIERKQFTLKDSEILKLAEWGCLIEKHYSAIAAAPQPMDIEWAKDGLSGELFIVQARPETVHSMKKRSNFIESYNLSSKPPQPLLTGQAVGQKISTGVVRVVHHIDSLSQVQEGDVLVATNTNPDWEPVMRRVAAIVTDQGGRTAHAAIVSRELGLTCIVGCGNATTTLKDGETVTVSCAEGPEGKVYPGKLAFTVDREDISDLPATDTSVMLNIADPAQAFVLSSLPVEGVGLARIEFIISNSIGIHPMAIVNFTALNDKAVINDIRSIAAAQAFSDPAEFFVTRLAEGIGRIAAAFYPKPVIVRTSDFKTNEYSKLIGGSIYEPDEENPMLGFRGASRYYDDRYRAGFALECAALKRVRSEMGLTNVRIMIPFCRTVDEGRQVIAELAANGLIQGVDGLEIFAMCELPSNVVSADKFLQVFDGYSIGSNDLTQLILGIDRDSGTISGLFNEEDESVLDMIAAAIAAAKRAGKPIGICGQAPSDKPNFAEWLVMEGITSISLNADSVIKTRRHIFEVEQRLKKHRSANAL